MCSNTLVMVRRRSAYVNWMYSESKLMAVPSETLVAQRRQYLNIIQYNTRALDCSLFQSFHNCILSLFKANSAMTCAIACAMTCL